MRPIPFVVRWFVFAAGLWLAVHAVAFLAGIAAGVFFGVSGGRYG